MCGGGDASGACGGNGSFDFIKFGGGGGNRIVTCDFHSGGGGLGWGGGGKFG